MFIYKLWESKRLWGWLTTYRYHMFLSPLLFFLGLILYCLCHTQSNNNPHFFQGSFQSLIIRHLMLIFQMGNGGTGDELICSIGLVAKPVPKQYPPKCEV